MKTLRLRWTTVCVDGTTEVFVPDTDWMRAPDVAKIRLYMEARGFTGLMNVIAGYQTCNVDNSPDAHNTIGSFVTTAGVTFGASFADVTANTQAKQYVRFGWVVKLTSGSTLATVRVGGSIDIIPPA